MLKTDYKDDVFPGSRKHKMIDNGDAAKTVTMLDMTEYVQEGDRFGGNDINLTNEVVNRLDADLSLQHEDATERSNIIDGEKLPTVLGKIKKFFSDLKAVAFSGSYTDLTDVPSPTNSLLATVPGTALDAVQGQVLGVKTDVINQSLAECNFVTEGSGVDTKYYIQRGADAASKKKLGDIENVLQIKEVLLLFKFGEMVPGSRASASADYESLFEYRVVGIVSATAWFHNYLEVTKIELKNKRVYVDVENNSNATMSFSHKISFTFIGY